MVPDALSKVVTVFKVLRTSPPPCIKRKKSPALILSKNSGVALAKSRPRIGENLQKSGKIGESRLKSAEIG